MFDVYAKVLPNENFRFGPTLPTFAVATTPSPICDHLLNT